MSWSSWSGSRTLHDTSRSSAAVPTSESTCARLLLPLTLHRRTIKPSDLDLHGLRNPSYTDHTDRQLTAGARWPCDACRSGRIRLRPVVFQTYHLRTLSAGPRTLDLHDNSAASCAKTTIGLTEPLTKFSAVVRASLVFASSAATRDPPAPMFGFSRWNAIGLSDELV